MSKKSIFPIFLLCFALLATAVFLRHHSTIAVTHPQQIGATPIFSPTPTLIPAVIAPAVVPTSSPVGKLQGKILMFHYIRSGVDPKKDPIGYGLSIPPDEFDHQLSVLKQQDYMPISMSDLLAGKGGSHTVVLTFDDGYEDFYTTAYPILKKYGYTATLYIITGKIGGDYMTWDQLRELQKGGYEIGAHTVTHPDLSKLPNTRQYQELADSKATLEQQLGVSVTHLCYPSGKYTAATIGIAKSLGYTDATTTHSGSVGAGDDPFTLNRYRMGPGMLDETLLHLFD